MTDTDAGIGKVAPKSLPTSFTIACFIAVALYNVAELFFIIFATFKKRRGLYFWSFLVSTCGIGLYSIGFLLKDLSLSSQSVFFVTLIVVGWSSMVTGQSVVLYSRLHLVLRDPRKLRLVLIMIICNAVICHVPIIVMVYGANSSNPTPFLLPYSIYEKVQVTIFFIQELLISGLYIIHTIKILRLEGNIRGKASREVMTHLIYVNAIIVFLDLTILGLEYSGLYDIQTAYKGLVYSVKLKLEFSILNRLVELTKNGKIASQSSERGGVHMETFDGRHRRQTRDDGQGAGYMAYIHSAGVQDLSGGDEIKQNDKFVVMTTQVSVHRDGERNQQDSEEELDSIGGKSGVVADEIGDRIISPSSSQVRFAKDGF
ncbi:hypothetical protein L207DRAFT_582374 [Hyaloscypha variabilis F]|uniref:DUF7703 domain-containing protein n=1 Tax=Hyaloscypha variabilis (strain UAMH 11265 / GT02V1 / F) TaxID=1149755 RepID=A0A2J6RTV6_HYAVF|nr:hypothetical protein L207DRAFT_582374 [Hyaloscypha variabilis F]